MKHSMSRRRALGLAAAVVALLAVPAAGEAQSACGAGYTVRTGDSLLEIAERCGVTVPALLAANPGVRDRMDLEVGDRLRVPDAGAPQPSPREACGLTYTIRTGDTLAEIAQKCGVTVPLLVAVNGRLPDPLGIHEGERIRIPDLPQRAVADTTLFVAPAAEPEPAETDTTAEATDDVEELVRVEGLLRSGEPCLLVRADDGSVYALAGSLNDAFRAGQRVVVLGVPAEETACDRSPTLEVRVLYRGG